MGRATPHRYEGTRKKDHGHSGNGYHRATVPQRGFGYLLRDFGNLNVDFVVALAGKIKV